MKTIQSEAEITPGKSRLHFANIGKVFGKVTTTGLVKFDRRDSPYMFTALCSCGSEFTVRPSHLYTGKTRSCGCWHKEAISTSFGDTKSSNEFHWLYHFWRSVRYRTTKETNPNYKYYHDRAPTDPEWEDFPTFKAAFLENFQRRFGRVHPAEGESLDRENNDKPYSLDNLRFASPQQQVRNRKNTVKSLKVEGGYVPIADIHGEFFAQSQVSYQNFVKRFTVLGWPLSKSLGLSPEEVKAYAEFFTPPTIAVQDFPATMAATELPPKTRNSNTQTGV